MKSLSFRSDCGPCAEHSVPTTPGRARLAGRPKNRPWPRVVSGLSTFLSPRSAGARETDRTSGRHPPGTGWRHLHCMFAVVQRAIASRETLSQGGMYGRRAHLDVIRAGELELTHSATRCQMSSY